MDIPRNEYPRPQFERASWINLNGEWSCTLDITRTGTSRLLHKEKEFERKITVPFCPESSLSGIGFTDYIESMYYQRNIEIPSDWQDKLIMLNFGGVDYECVIYIDGEEIARHVGGSSPFAVRLNKYVVPGRTHNLVIHVKDNIRSGLQPSGKQSVDFKSKNCNYTRVTGIWQTVYLEAIDRYGLKNCRIVPDFDNGSFSFIPSFYNVKCGQRFTVDIFAGGSKAASQTVNACSGQCLTIKLDDPKAWDVVDPFLYDIVYTVTDADGKVLDTVKSYAGLRKIHLEDGRFYLNNKPIYLRFVLDQGYYPDGIWTAPDDEALIRDIQLSLDAGFNGARLHQKIFDERFHYHADRMGYLTWAEFPDWGISFWQHYMPANRDYQQSFRDYFAEWSAIVERDMNHPSIIAWTPFNETQLMPDINEHRRIIGDIYDLTKRLDPTRPVNDTSGYTHVKTDLWTVHKYSQNVEEFDSLISREPAYMPYPAVEMQAWDNQPYIVDEYGGVAYIPETDKPFADNSWGYNKDKLSQAEAEQRIADLTEYLVKHPRVTGYCYTQLTDVEQEQNGIYKYNRSNKFDIKKIHAIFSEKPDWSAF